MMAAQDSDHGRRLKEIAGRMEDELQDAEQELRALVRERPDDLPARLLLARLCFRRSGFEDMREQAEAAVGLAPRQPTPLSVLALSHYYLGDTEQAAECLGRLVALKPDHLGHARLAWCQHRLGRLEAALESHLQALVLAQAEQARWPPVSRFGLMAVLRDLGRGEEADRQAEALLKVYRAQPLAVSSTLLGFINRLDFHEWDRYRQKEELSDAIRAYRAAAGAGAFPAHPRSYVLPRDFEAFQDDALAGATVPPWILKPTFLYGGQGMRLLEDPGSVPCEAGYIVQSYLSDPYLVKGHKAHLRLYLLITAVTPPRAYLWADGIVRIAPEPYVPGPGWLERPAIHITNTALHKDHPDLVLSDDPGAEDQGHVWSLRALLRHIEAEGGDVAGLRERLCDLAGRLVRVIEHSGLFARQAEGTPPRAYPPKFIGLDVLLDAELRPWLLECQRMPGQTGSPLVEAVNGRLFRTITEMTVHPLGAEPDDWPAREVAAELERRGDFLPLELPAR